MTDQIRSGWKILTHDWRPPLQGGRPIAIKSWPHKLPKRELDTTDSECGAGWNYCGSIADGFRIAGIWRDGRAARVVLVDAATDAIARGNKRRASSLTLIREATEEEIAAGILEFSQCFGEHAAEMANEQVLWRRALARSGHKVKVVEESLRTALERRGLAEWRVKRHEAAWDAWAARDALNLRYAVLMRWVEQPADLLTAGIRDAYANGAAIVLPTGEKELGYSMEKK